jgi:hypothetical protein
VTSGEDAGDHQIDEFFLAEQHLIQPAAEGAKVFCGIGDFRFGGVFHGSCLVRMLAGGTRLEMKKV